MQAKFSLTHREIETPIFAMSRTGTAIELKPLSPEEKSAEGGDRWTYKTASQLLEYVIGYSGDLSPTEPLFQPGPSAKRLLAYATHIANRRYSDGVRIDDAVKVEFWFSDYCADAELSNCPKTMAIMNSDINRLMQTIVCEITTDESGAIKSVDRQTIIPRCKISLEDGKHKVELTLSDFTKTAIRKKHITTLPHCYVLLEDRARRVLEIVVSHMGRKMLWPISLEKLEKKMFMQSRTSSDRAVFRHRLKNLSIPGFRIEIGETDIVTFYKTTLDVHASADLALANKKIDSLAREMSETVAMREKIASNDRRNRRAREIDSSSDTF